VGYANRGHRECGVLPVINISHVGTKKVVGEERGKEGL